MWINHDLVPWTIICPVVLLVNTHHLDSISIEQLKDDKAALRLDSETNEESSITVRELDRLYSLLEEVELLNSGLLFQIDEKHQ